MTKPALIIALSALALSGCGELFGQTLNQPSGVVTSQLYRMPPGADLMRLPELWPGTKMRVESRDGSVIWTYSLKGEEVCRFTAHISPSGSEVSTVWTELDTLSSKDVRYLCTTVNIAGTESVAATLDGRDADRNKVEGELVAAAVGNIGSIQRGLADHILNERGSFDEICRDAPTSADMQSCRDGTLARDRSRRRD